VDVGDGTSRELQSDPGGRGEHRTDRAERDRRLRLEPLDRLGEAPISLGHDRPEEILGPFRVRFADPLEGVVEIDEDPAHLFFQEAEASGSESVDLRTRLGSEGLGCERVRRREIRVEIDGGARNQTWTLRVGEDRPSGLISR
jgi:hypothetical protein